MIDALVIGIAGLGTIAAATVLGPKLRIAPPLLLVAVGIVVSLLPNVSAVEIEPDLILEGFLPPLLYSTAVSMPAMNFRREFGAISSLSIVLVVASSLVLGLFFAWAIPGLGLAWGIALGAVVSPTDAAAVGILKQSRVSRRIVAILDGESLLNDATALVMLRTAIVSAASAFSFWGALGTFAYSVVVAIVIGAVVGWLNLAVRRRLSDAAVNTMLSFAVPFAASVPAELLGSSGLVAAVVAGIVTGIWAPRVLSPQHRLSDSQNWNTIELLLEGVVFLTMGLQLTGILGDVTREHEGVGVALLIAVGALGLTVAVRAAYVALLLRSLARRGRDGEAMQPRLASMKQRLDESGPDARAYQGRLGWRVLSERQLWRFSRRVTRSLADIDYFLKEPLGVRDGFVVVWAGMRGAVTVAAAQTLPEDTPNRATLLLIAFAVATLSLIVQGGTIGPILRRVGPGDADRTDDTDERRRIMETLDEAAAVVPDGDAGSDKEHRLAVLTAQRTALLDARDNGIFDADTLQGALANLDAAQIALEMRGGPAG